MKKKLITPLLLILFAIGCGTKKTEVDVSNINVSLTIERFDRDLFNLPLDSIKKYIPGMQNKYGRFYELYNREIIAIGAASSPAYPDYLLGFVTHRDWNEVYGYTQQIFENTDSLQQQLISAFKHYKYYFPEKKVPRVITYISGFNQSIITDEGLLGIGLDKYLGTDCKFYSYANIEQYWRKNMKKEKIVSDCMIAMASMYFEYNDSVNNLANNMIYSGQVLYFAEKMLPDMPDSLIIGYTTKETEWCENSEKDMWEYIIGKKLIFNSDEKEIRKFIKDGPFTPYFQRNSPSRTGMWLGWQIVRSYMKHNPEITLQQLMQKTDYQEILNNARYSP